MAYHKFLIDNPTCSRRFHASYDDSEQRQDKVSIDCPCCDKKIFEAKNHPPVKIARQENLVRTAVLAERLVDGCNFVDQLSVETVPNATKEDYKLYRD